MKTVFQIGIGLLLLQSAHAALYFEEHFSYGTGTLGSAGSSGGWSGSNSGVMVTTNSLDGTGLGLAVSSSNRVTTTTSSSSGTYRQFSSGITSGSVYVSFLLKVNSTSGLSTSGAPIVDLLKAGSSSSYYADVYLRLNGSTVEVGLAKLRGTPQWYGTPLALGSTYLVVVKYQFVANSNNDVVSLWVNPLSLGVSEPAADVVFSSGGDGNNSTGVGRCYIYGGASADVDELRVATTWAEVTPTGSSPPQVKAPYVTDTSLKPEGLVLRGTNGPAAQGFYLLASTDLALPLTNWTIVGSNAFDANGNFQFTNLVSAGLAKQFFRLRIGGEGPPPAPVAPAITTQPTNRTVIAGQSAGFSVAASGTAPLRYQWYFNTNTPLANATNANLTITNAQTTDAGGYSVVVTNTAGSATSVVATLTVSNVLAAPVITAQPQDRTVIVGQSTVFSVTATGTAPLSYQWYFNTNTPLDNATNALLTLTNAQANDAGGYLVILTNSLGSATSLVAALTVNPAPTNGGFVQVLQAEDGVFAGTVDSDYAGYTGSGYVNTDNAVGSYIEWEFGMKYDGSQMLFVRYAHNKSDNRTAELRVNDVVVAGSVDFPPTSSWTSWELVSNAIPVRTGMNKVRLTALTSGGLANTDCIEVTGDPQYKLKVAASGRGTVSLAPTNAYAYYNPGTLVTVTAVPQTGSVFVAWSGALTGTNNPETTVIDTNKSVTATFNTLVHVPIYVSPTGNDANPGTFEAPFFSLSPAVAAAVPGDTIYMRGGTYNYLATVFLTQFGTESNQFNIFAFPGEQPVLSWAGWTPANETERGAARGLKITGGYWHLKGLEICYAPDNGVKCEGHHITFEQCVFHHNGDGGLQIGLNKDTLSSNPDPEHMAAYNYVLNCDAYRNADPATSYENADGFSCKLYAGIGNHFYGCRAWENCDDGWDCYQTDFEIVLENCWAWHNGDPSLWGFSSFNGDGNGFKLGGASTYCPIIVRNCVALNCQWGTTVGFAYNNNTAPITLYNCDALNCGRPYNMQQAGNIIKNCLDLNSTRHAPSDISSSSIQQNNSWDLAITVAANDFISLAEADAAAPRQADGSLPNNGFARLRPGSALIDRGVDVGLPYNGAAPDLGAFECVAP